MAYRRALLRPPEVPLGPLTDCLARRVILSLPWLERVRAERVCRGWKACLRTAPAAVIDTATALAECRAAGLRFSRNKDGEPETRKAEVVVAEALRLRAAAAAHSFRIGDDHSLLTLLVPAPAQGIKLLSASDVSAAALNAAFDALAGADGSRPLPPRLRLQRVLLSNATGLADCDAVRLFNRRVAVAAAERATAAKAAAAVVNMAVAGDLSAEAAAQAMELEAAADAAFAEAADAGQLHVRLSPEFLAYVEDAGDDAVVDDARVVRCARLGRPLARQHWPRVTVELYRLDESLTEEGGSAALATLLEVCFSSMQDELDVLHLAPTALDRRCTFDLRNSGAFLNIRDACRVVRAAPQHLRVLFGDVTLDRTEDVAALPGVLVPNREHGATVCISFEGPFEPAVMSRLTSALSAAGCAESGLDLSSLTLDLESDAHIFSSLRNLTTLRGLSVSLDDDSIAELLAVLPPSLRRLSIAGSVVTEKSHLLAAALLRGRLPVLECLNLKTLPNNDAEAARILADFARRRQQAGSPFILFCRITQDEPCSWDVLTSLMKYARPASGVLAHAALKMLRLTCPVPLDQLDELVANIFAALREDSEVCMPDQFMFQVYHLDCEERAGVSVLARLLLHLHDRAPAQMAALLSLPEHVLLIATRVRRARSQLALTDDFLFTPLLHRMLLIVASGTGDLPLSVLSAVADSCIRDEPEDPDAEFDGPEEAYDRRVLKCSEARFALLTMLLACALAGEACSDYLAFTGAIQCRELHSSWLLYSVTSFCIQATAGRSHFLSLRDGMGALKFSAADAALHLWALARVPSLHGKFLGEEMQEYLQFDLILFLKQPEPTHWLHLLLKDSPSSILFDALDALAPLYVAYPLYCHFAVTSMSVKPAAALADMDHIARKLNRVLLSWAGVVVPSLVTDSNLLPRLGDACIALLSQQSPGARAPATPNMMHLAHAASLAWCLATETGSLTLTDTAAAWVILNLSALLSSIRQMHVSAIAGNPGCRSFFTAALILRAAGTAFCCSLDPDSSSQFPAHLGSMVSPLVTAGWVRYRGSANPLRADIFVAPLFHVALTAEAAYKGLARLIQKLPPDYVKSLSVQLQTSVSGGAPAVLDNLGRELAQLAALQRRMSEICALDRHAQNAANAHAHFSAILRTLRPALEPRIAGLQLSTYAFSALTAARSTTPVAEVAAAKGAV